MLEDSRPAELADYPVVVVQPVQWGDMDAFGHVNNTVPIRWFETARIVYLQQSGMQKMMDTEGVGPILASITCQYRRQLTYPDTVHIGARISRMGGSSMVMEHAVFSEASGGIAAEGESVVVVFNYKINKSQRVSDAVRGAIGKTELREVEGAG